MAARGSHWADWVARLPSVVERLIAEWAVVVDGPSVHGNCSVVMPVRTDAGEPAMLKVGFPEEDSEHEHLALRRWGGHGAVRLLRAEPHLRALLLERLGPTDLAAVPEEQACEVMAGLYRQLHVPALGSLRSLAAFVEHQSAQLANLPRSAPIPHRLVEQAVTLGSQLCADGSVPQRVLHTDLHYANVLAGGRERWLAIDPKPLNGDPHYEIAPMLWNRWAEIPRGRERSGVLRRLWSLVDAAGFDEDRARGWVVVRMVHNAMWETQERNPDRNWITRCIAVAKAMGE